MVYKKELDSKLNFSIVILSIGEIQSVNEGSLFINTIALPQFKMSDSFFYYQLPSTSTIISDYKYTLQSLSFNRPISNISTSFSGVLNETTRLPRGQTVCINKDITQRCDFQLDQYNISTAKFILIRVGFNNTSTSSFTAIVSNRIAELNINNKDTNLDLSMTNSIPISLLITNAKILLGSENIYLFIKYEGRDIEIKITDMITATPFIDSMTSKNQEYIKLDGTSIMKVKLDPVLIMKNSPFYVYIGFISKTHAYLNTTMNIKINSNEYISILDNK